MSRKKQQERRDEIKRILGFLDERNHYVFRRMYSQDLSKDVYQVVDDMPANQLQWALHQCLASYHNIFRILKS